MKGMNFYDMPPCNSIKSTDVTEELAASIFRVEE
jgi:hypothetical protein